MTTTIELSRPINVAGGKKGAETIESFEMADLLAGHMWDMPATDLGPRHTLILGCTMAGFDKKKANAASRALTSKDIRTVTAQVNVGILQFKAGTENIGEGEINPDESFKLVLETPVKLGKEMVGELNLRPLIGKDVWDIPGQNVNFGHLFGVGSSQAEVSDVVVKRLSAWDAGQLVGVVNGFLADFLKTGEEP